MPGGDQKRTELIEIAKTALLTLPQMATPLAARTADDLAAAIVDSFASITPPPNIFYTITIKSAGGRVQGGGFTTKPGNIVLNWRKLFEEASASLFPVVAATQIPWLVPFAALVVWSKLRSAMTIEITKGDALVLYAMWTHREKDNKVEGERVLEFVNADLAKCGQSPMRDKDLDSVLERLEKLHCIEMFAGKWLIREYIRVTYR